MILQYRANTVLWNFYTPHYVAFKLDLSFLTEYIDEKEHNISILLK